MISRNFRSKAEAASTDIKQDPFNFGGEHLGDRSHDMEYNGLVSPLYHSPLFLRLVVPETNSQLPHSEYILISKRKKHFEDR